MENYGIGQNFNPHGLRRLPDFGNSFNVSNNFNISFDKIGLLERKIILEKKIGKNKYKKIVSKMKKLSRW